MLGVALLLSESMNVFYTLRGKPSDEVIDVDAEVRQPRAAARCLTRSSDWALTRRPGGARGGRAGAQAGSHLRAERRGCAFQQVHRR